MPNNIATGDAEYPRLLLVDDSATNRAVATSILARLGYAADAVQSGQDAVEALHHGHYDAVLMDIWMPGMDGFASTAAIRELPPPLGDLPVIAMTAHAGAEERRRCLDFGMAEHIGKPIDRAELAAVLLRIVGPPAGAEVGPDLGTRPGSPGNEELVSDDILEQLRSDAGAALVKELVAAYMDETDERLGCMDAAVARGDLEAVAADAHSLKSSSGTFGAVLLQTAAEKLEAAATDGDAAAATAIHTELADLISATWTAFASRGFSRS